MKLTINGKVISIEEVKKILFWYVVPFIPFPSDEVRGTTQIVGNVWIPFWKVKNGTAELTPDEVRRYAKGYRDT